jgi:hypothetical protein
VQRINRRLRFFLTLAAPLVLPVLAAAAPVTGSFGFAGPGVLVFKTGGPDFIRFCTFADSSCVGPATATGDLKVSGPGSQAFSVLTTADIGNVDNVTDGSPPVAPFTYFPVGTAVAIDHWLSLASHPTWNFRANLLPPATCTPTPTQLCIGPFQLNQSGPNVEVFMAVNGIIINTTDGSISSFSATFTGGYDRTTIAAVAALAQSPGGILSDSWAGSILATAATGCPASPGFWKKHPFPSALTFPVTIGGTPYSANDFHTVLGNPGGGNAIHILGFQLVAAILNIAAGAQLDVQAMNAIQQANADLNGLSLLTSSVAPSSALGQDMINQASILDNYNNGFFGTCNEGTALTLGGH